MKRNAKNRGSRVAFDNLSGKSWEKNKKKEALVCFSLQLAKLKMKVGLNK